MEILIFFLLLAFFFWSIFWFILLIKKSKFPENRKKFFLKKISEIKRISDFEKKILNYDKLLDQLLKEKKYIWTLWEKLKRNPNIFLDINDLWFAHKMRNKIVHEVNPNISQKDFMYAEKIFQKEIEQLLK